MKKYPFWALAASFIASLALLVILFLTSFQSVIFNRGFVDREMQKYKVADSIGMDQPSLMVLYDEMLKYLEDKREDLNIRVVRYGQEQDAFYEKELLHMVDVKGLFVAGFKIRNYAIPLALGLILVVCLVKSRGKHVAGALPRGFLAASVVFLLIVTVLGVALTADFERAFILFHEIFFTNDLWQLNYQTDLLMNIVPEVFSRDVAIHTVIRFTIVFVLMIAASFIWIHRDRKSVKS
ncbi:MAG: TIGR01906 family membrane protein [Firmicutes bacterium]|nr:TIGR01906 family membrane protein [Bacillota bacterium]